MKSKKLEEATMKALQGKLEEVYVKEYLSSFSELYSSSWGPAIEVLDKIAENDLEDELMNWLEDLGTEDTPIDRTELNDYIIFQSEDIYDALGLDENGDPLDESKKIETKGSDKTYTCIEDRQGGDFAVGYTMTAEEWGETAYSWAYGDDWTDPEEPLLKNFDTEQECIDFIQDMWELTIVPSDDPQAKEFLKEDNDVEIPADLQDYVNSWKEKVGGDVKSIKYLGGTSTPNDMVKINNVMYEFNRSTKKLVRKVPASFTDKKEARSHKEDNERVAPRTTTRNGKEVKITDIQKDLDNTFVGKRYAKGAVANNPYYGGQYYGTTDAEYRSKRNKTGQKRTSTIDMSKRYDVYKADTFETPVTNYQSAMNRYKSYEETGDEDVPIAQSYKKSAQDIVNKERERIANKQKNTESKNTSKLSVKIVLDENKKEKAKRNIIPKNHKLNEGYSMENFRISGNICNIISFDSIDIQEKKYDENYDEYYDINAKCNIIAEIQDLELDYGPHKAYIDKFNPKIKITELETYGTIDNEDFKDKGRLEQIIAEDIYGTSFSELINISIYPGYKGEPIQAELYKADIVGYIKFEFIEQPVIDYINFKWDDENDINYRLVDENGDIIEELGDRKDAINLAEKTPKCVAVIEVYYDWYLTDGEGSEDSDYCEDGRTVWTREKKTEGLKGNTIPRNWKKITYKSKIDTNLNKAGDTLEVERDEWDRPIVKNTSTGETGLLNWDIIKNPELVEIINIEKKTEARNPENDEINTKIRKSLNGSTKYKDDLEKAGLEVSQNEKGKVTTINDMNKEDLKNSHPDTDYYNYLTKQKVQPEVTDTGAFSTTNSFRNSDNFENTISKKDRTVYQVDNNGVSRAIPKKYKTGRKNFGYNPDEFPRKNYNGVASYEPLDDKELKDFKYAKSTTSDGGWKKQDLNRAKAEYDRAKAEYDKDANKVNSIRDRIAKSKANRKAEARSHKEDRKITEATTDVNEVVDEYKEAYHKDLDLKTVPCVIARDKMLSGWGGAEGRNHYQVVLCADSTEAHNIASNMQAQAKREQLANVRVSFGVKLPSRASVAYCVGRNASAWNMGDSWYEKYDTTEKKIEDKKVENSQGNNQGICPKCGSMITDYGDIFWDDNGIGQEFNCTNPECKAHGTEYYNTIFDYIEVDD